MQKVYCQDCLEVMKEYPDDYFDLILTDPPYGISESGKKNHSRGRKTNTTKFKELGWDEFIPTKKYFDEIRRCSKNQIIFGGNYFIEYLKNSPCWIIWDKDNGKTDFADSELAWTNFKSAVRNFKWKWQGMLQEDMGKRKEKREHPTQKPVELMVWCLENYLMKKWKKDRPPRVLDCFAGSGTTGVACQKMGIDFVLIEKEPDYIEIIKNRLKQQVLF